jgi:glycosyltransferase involved in cell wall biosynthesis
MKILMVLESDFTPDIRVENEVEYLFKLGHDVTVACITQKHRPKFETLKYCKITRKQITDFTKKTSVGCLKFPFYFNFWFKFLNNILQKEKFDVIHIHDLPLTKVGIKLKQKFNIPLVVDLHENWPALIKDAKHTNTLLGKILSSNKQWEKYESIVLHKADKIITVVEEMKNRILKFGLQPDDIFVLPNVMNLSSLDKEITNEYKGKVLFYAGGLNKHRGLQIAIQGLAILPPEYSYVELRIVGFGNYEKDLKALVNKLDLKERVIFLGRKSQQETYREMNESDIMLIPHLRSVQTDNSSPNKLYQYMYSEKPILSSNCSSLERIINLEKIGCIYEDENPEDFSLKLIELMNINKNNYMGKNGKKAVIQKYNWSFNEKVLAKIYSQV